MKTTLKLQNVKCGACTNGIAVRLLKLSGVHEVQISDGASEVTFSYDTINDLADAERTLTLMGYPPEDATNNFKHKAVSYLSCMVGNLNK